MQLKAHPANFVKAFDLKPPQRWQPDSIELPHATLAANLVVGFEPRNERAQPFFGLRSQVLKHVEETQQRVLAVTSVQPGNGKTHIAVNLAAALSRITPTVLVELDLHRPTVGSRLGLPSDHLGIDDFLDGGCAWHQAAMHVGGFDLDVYRVREPRDAAEGLLTGPRMAEFFEHLRAHPARPVCIVDTPPTIIGDDIMLISRVIDGVLMVVQEARTPKRALREAIRTLHPTPIIGSVLNMSITQPPCAQDYGYYDRPKERPKREPRYL
jgi:Mrp family chromosome partitioning ATPase